VFHPQNLCVQLSGELLSICVAGAQVIEMHRRSNGALAADEASGNMEQ